MTMYDLSREIRRRVAVMQKCYEINHIPFPEGTLTPEA